MRKIPILAALALLLVLASRAYGAEDEKILKENWYVIYSHGIRSGYNHDITISIPSKKLIKTVSEVVQKTRRGDDVIETPSTSTWVETEDGRPVSFSSRDRESTQDTVVEGVVEADTARVRITTYGKVEEKVIPWDRRVIFSAAQDRLVVGKGFRKGTKVEYWGFEIDLLKASRQVLTMEGDEEVSLVDGKKLLHKVSIAYDLHPELRVYVWCDDNALPHRVYMSLGQSDFYLTTKEKAVNITAPTSDMMDKTSIPLTTRLPFFYRLDYILYRLTFTEKFDAKNLIDSRQQIMASNAASVDLQVKSLPLTQIPDPPETLEDRELYLQETPYLQWKDAAVQKISQKAVGGATLPVAQAKALREWVYKNLKKNYAIGFASAKEVGETLTGDCTEHAVLLAAMLRACGIPSRVAVGLICTGNEFGWHMWTQAFLGRWVDLDATLPLDECTPAHIRLGESPLKDTGTEEIISATNLIGNLRIEVLEYAMKGKRIDPADPPKEYLIKDGWYVNSFYDFRFYKPRSWEFLTREQLKEKGKDAAVAFVNSDARAVILVDCHEGVRTKEELTSEMPTSLRIKNVQELKMKNCTGYEFTIFDKTSGYNCKFLFVVSKRATYTVVMPVMNQEAERGYQTLVSTFEIVGE
jgi:hypothetical protein